MSDRQCGDPMHEAQYGDLRPQVNPRAAVTLADLPHDRPALRAILLDRFLQLRRPIANASAGGGPAMRLHDAGSFFYLVEALQRLGCPELEDTLCVLLDEFTQLDTHAYDELYLWSIVQLSRTGAQHAQTYWPLVLALDLQHRAAPWQRPAGVHPVEQPYRLTELLFYYYAIYTLRKPSTADYVDSRQRTWIPAPSLWEQLEPLTPTLREDQLRLAREALRDLKRAERGRAVFGDAAGLLARWSGR